ncbi:MAG: hypothetical protein J7L37_09320 [Thermococcus sp.]|nr:hypothetical protein [Thermococcus sp.]
MSALSIVSFSNGITRTMVYFSKSINQKQLTKIFAEFLKEDPIALRELGEINKIQRSIIDLGLTHQNDIATSFNIQQKSYYTTMPTSCYGYCSEEQVRVTINYLRVHVVRWDITYGEVDKFNWLYTGLKAREFFDKWEDVTTNAGYATTLLGFGTTLIKFPNPVSIAIGAALTAAGLTITYEGSEMVSYYESTNWQYIWMVLENDYYYPWVPVMNLASHFSIYGYNANSGKKYTFLPSVPIPAVGGYTNAVISSMLSEVAHDWIKSHGSDWVTVA